MASKSSGGLSDLFAGLTLAKFSSQPCKFYLELLTRVADRQLVPKRAVDQLAAELAAGYSPSEKSL